MPSKELGIKNATKIKVKEVIKVEEYILNRDLDGGIEDFCFFFQKTAKSPISPSRILAPGHLEMPGFEMPGSEMPDFKMPGFEMPGFKMPGFRNAGFQKSPVSKFRVSKYPGARIYIIF